MNAASLEKHLLLQIEALEKEGIIDEKLSIFHSLKKENGPDFFVELIRNFLADARLSINEMTMKLNQSDVDYDHLFQLHFKLRGSVVCIGACKMALSFPKLHQALDIRSKERCLSALDGIKLDFSELRPKFDALIQMEMEILSQNKQCDLSG